MEILKNVSAEATRWGSIQVERATDLQRTVRRDQPAAGRNSQPEGSSAFP